MRNKKDIITVLVIVVFLISLIVYLNHRAYTINVNGKEYRCNIRIKNESRKENEEYFIGISKNEVGSMEEALEKCKQDEVVIYSSTGELEEYQEKRTYCEFKDEDEESYNFYPGTIYSYKECIEVK